MSHKKAFTLIEVMICVLMLSVVGISLSRYGTQVTNSLIKTKEIAEQARSEYSDVLELRASEDVPELQHSEYLRLVSSGSGVNLYVYEGEYLVYYRMMKG